MADSNYWGGINSSKDYLLMMEGSTPVAKPEELVGHSFTNFSVDQIDRVTSIGVRLRGNRIQEVQRVLRPAKQTGVTGTVGFDGGAVYTPLLQKIRRRACEIDLYIKRLCSPNDEYAHFYAVPDAVFNPPTFVNDLITTDDTTNPVTLQSEFQGSDFILSFNVGAFVLANLTPPLYGVAFMTQDECEDCDEALYQSFIVVGGAGGAMDAAYAAITDDRFGNMSVLTTGIADGNSILGVYTRGNTILLAFADTPVVASGASGGTAFSSDRGSSFTLDSNLSSPMHDVDYFEGQYIAVGGVGGAAAEVWVSDGGITWTQVTSSALPADETLVAIAVDEDNECFYAVGTGGTAVKGTKGGQTINLSALSPSGVSTTNLLSVAVFGDNHIAIGGASNYYVESFDGGSSWTAVSIPGSAAVSGIAGYGGVRTAVASGLVVADRTILNNNDYTIKTLQGGASITGDYTDLAGSDGEHEYFIAVTDDGEAVLLKPFYPGS